MLLEHFQKLYAEFRQRKLRVDAANLFKLTSVIIQVTTPSRTPHRTHHRAALPQPRRTAAARHCPSAATGPRFVCPLVFCLAGLTLPSPPPSLRVAMQEILQSQAKKFGTSGHTEAMRAISDSGAVAKADMAENGVLSPAECASPPRLACCARARRPRAVLPRSPRGSPRVRFSSLACPAPRSPRTPRATPFAEQRRGPPCCPHPALCATRSCR